MTAPKAATPASPPRRVSWWIWLLFVIVAGGAIHVGSLWALPRVIVAVVRWRLTSLVGVNHIHHAALPDASWRTIVMPSPDLLYSACAFDLRQHPLLVDAVVPDGYWSISAFSSATDNFFVQNDSVVTDPRVKNRRPRYLFTADASWPDDPERTVVRSPTPTGVILFRILVRDRKDLAALEAIQKQAVCAPLL